MQPVRTAIPIIRQPVLIELDEFERRMLEGLRELREKIVRSDEQRRIEFEAARAKRRLQVSEFVNQRTAAKMLGCHESTLSRSDKDGNEEIAHLRRKAAEISTTRLLRYRRVWIERHIEAVTKNQGRCDGSCVCDPPNLRVMRQG